MTKSQIEYLNTDLQIQSDQPFNLLHQFLVKNGIFELRYDEKKLKRGAIWTGWFEVNEVIKKSRIPQTPEKTIRKFINILNRLGPAELKEWQKAKTKIFDIGYDSGQEPREFLNDLSSELVQEIGKLGAGITITIYAQEE